MQIKNNYIKTLFKLFITITILECIYLFAVPFVLDILVNKSYIADFINNKTNAKLSYSNAKIKTHLKPELSVFIQDICISDKENNNILVDVDNLEVKLNFFKLLKRKLTIKNLSASNLFFNIEKDENGKYNFQKLFPSNQKKSISLDINNSAINIQKYTFVSLDKTINEDLKIEGEPLKIDSKKNKYTIALLTKGQFIANNSISDFDIDINAPYPINFKNLSTDNITGKCFIYNLNLKPILPIVQNYLNKDITKLEGIIEFLQLSTNIVDDKQNLITLNTKFKNVIFDKKSWPNYIVAKGENKFDTKFELFKNTIDVKSLNFKADKVNIKANGLIHLQEKPELDINIEVEKSRAENIVPLLPPNIPTKYKTLGKVKTYGVYGDLDAKVKIKGKIPQPDITGFVKGRNVHVLDKSIHNLHKGTVDINFEKRILNMNILVDLFDNQKATVKGYTYMYRDGINNVTIKTTDNIDFPLAQKIVIPISKVFNFQLGPIPEMNITSGKGIIDINIQGSIDYVNLNGYCNFDKAQLTYNGLYGEILNGKGRVDFKGDAISFKSERAFVKNNPLSVDGKVRLNKNLNFNISSNLAEAKDLMEIINKSSLLEDVKKGLAIITEASGNTKIFLNIAANIVPVPFGYPPLPPDEAFKDMRVKGSLYLLGNTCKIDGFYTPIHSIKGMVDFTETETKLNNIEGISGTSPVVIEGTILNDIETKIPDVDITITSKSVNLKDTIRFLTESYLYPKNYPNLSPLYKIASKHDLLFKYKAKAIDFITDKAYAVMNFIPDDTQSSLKAKSGRVIMENSTVKVENINADLFDSTLKVNGTVEKIDTINPIYNLKINSDGFNLANLNNLDNMHILPKEIKDIFAQFNNYSGFADINVDINKNIINGTVKLIKPSLTHIKSKIPLAFENFNVYLKNNKLIINDVSAQIANMPFFGELTIFDLTKKQNMDGFLTTKLSNNFIKEYLPKNLADKINIFGDINMAVDIKGTTNNIVIEPKLTLHPEADVIIDGVSLGEINDKREFNAKFILDENKVTIKKLDYIKYISSHNNTNNAIVFATINGILDITENGLMEPRELQIKTNKNLSAKFLNLILQKTIFSQGTFNCDLKYIFDKSTKTAKVKGDLDCRNIDIPLFDTLIKNIKLKANDEDIDINLFGFINDSKISINSILENNIYKNLNIHTLNIVADQIDNNKLLSNMAEIRKLTNATKQTQNKDLFDINIEKGSLIIKKLIVKSMLAENFMGNFSIDKNSVFKADDVNVTVGTGNIHGDILYDLKSSDIEGNFELNNVDANYVAETLFDAKNQVYGNANGKIILKTQGTTGEEIVKNLNGFVFFDMIDGKMPKLGSLEYLLRAGNIVKSGITSFSLNNILELLNLVKTGYFSNINGSCAINNGVAENIEIFSKGENMSLYIHGSYDIAKTHADMEILGNISKNISTIFGAIGNTSLNTFFKLIPGISMIDFSRKDFIENVEKIPSFTNGSYESRTFQAIINGNINESGYVQTFKWVK